MIDLGESGHQDFLKVLSLMAASIDEASDVVEGSDYTDAFEFVLSQTQGVGAMISRQWGFLKSTRGNADHLKNISDPKGGGIYRTLCNNEYYGDLVREF